MAAKKTNTLNPIIDQTLIYNKEGKKEKEGGKVYWLAKEYNVDYYGKYMIPSRTRFVECNDGYYWVYLDGERLYFRFGPLRMSAMKDFLSEQVNTI